MPEDVCVQVIVQLRSPTYMLQPVVQLFPEALGNLSQALSNAGTGGYYNRSNASYNEQNSPSDNNNTRNYQASYDIWAKQAERLYNKLAGKDGYAGSSKTRTVDVNAFHKAQGETRNIGIKAANAGKPVQKSVYQSKVIHWIRFQVYWRVSHP